MANPRKGVVRKRMANKKMLRKTEAGVKRRLLAAVEKGDMTAEEMAGKMEFVERKMKATKRRIVS